MRTHDVPLLVLHDFDVSGFTIFGTLRSSTQRYTYRRKFRVVDLGLRLADIAGLEREGVYVSSPSKTAATLHRHGATRQEIDIFRRRARRAECACLRRTSRVDRAQARQARQDKMIPDDGTLADAYRRIRRQAAIQEKIEELVEALDGAEVKVPAGLRQRIKKAMMADPTRPWDAVLREIAVR